MLEACFIEPFDKYLILRLRGDWSSVVSVRQVQEANTPTNWVFPGSFDSTLCPVFVPSLFRHKPQMIICHAQHSFVCSSTVGVDLLNTTLKILAVKSNAYSKIDEGIYTDLNPLISLLLSEIPGAHD